MKPGMHFFSVIILFIAVFSYSLDIVFFGEALPDRFDECLKEDIDKIDLLLVMGSSLKVKPVAYVPGTFSNFIY